MKKALIILFIVSGVATAGGVCSVLISDSPKKTNDLPVKTQKLPPKRVANPPKKHELSGKYIICEDATKEVLNEMPEVDVYLCGDITGTYHKTGQQIYLYSDYYSDIFMTDYTFQLNERTNSTKKVPSRWLLSKQKTDSYIYHFPISTENEKETFYFANIKRENEQELSQLKIKTKEFWEEQKLKNSFTKTENEIDHETNMTCKSHYSRPTQEEVKYYFCYNKNNTNNPTVHQKFTSFVQLSTSSPHKIIYSYKGNTIEAVKQAFMWEKSGSDPTQHTFYLYHSHNLLETEKRQFIVRIEKFRERLSDEEQKTKDQSSD